MGDSHVDTYLNAVREAGGPTLNGGPLAGASSYFKDFFNVEDGKVTFIEEEHKLNYSMWKERTESDGIESFPRRLILSVGLAGTPFYGNRMWRRFSTTPSQSRFMSRGMFDSIVAATHVHTKRFYDYCVERDLVIAAIVAPAPQRRHRAVEALGAERVVELNAAFQQPIRDYARSKGIKIIDPEWADEKGLLRPEFEGPDAQHAGPACGPILAAAIRKALD